MSGSRDVDPSAAAAPSAPHADGIEISVEVRSSTPAEPGESKQAGVSRPAKMTGWRLAAVYVSRILVFLGVVWLTTKLSGLTLALAGPALWMPEEWRLFLQWLMPVVGVVVVFKLLRMNLRNTGAKDKPASAGGKDEPVGAVSGAGESARVGLTPTQSMYLFRGLALSLAAFVGVAVLTAHTVRVFPNQELVDREFAGHRPPSFVDLKRNQIMLPPQWLWSTQFSEELRRDSIAANTPSDDPAMRQLVESPWALTERLQRSDMVWAFFLTRVLFTIAHLAFGVGIATILAVTSGPLEGLIEDALGEVLGSGASTA